MLSFATKFVNYWYFRYLLVTELYMVEKWERAMFHIVFFIAFALFFLFNATVTLTFVSWIQNYLFGFSSPEDTLIIHQRSNLHAEM